MRLFYRKYGSGPPLVILHGLFGSSDNWVSFARSISDRYTVYLPDLRNHGQSPHSQDQDYASMVVDLTEMANDAGIKKFFLAGHSMGGKTAALFAITFPERLNGLIIADISPFSDSIGSEIDLSNHRAILDFILNADLAELKSRSETEALLSKKISSTRIKELVLKNLKREADNSFSWKINAKAINDNFGKIMGPVAGDLPDRREISGFPVYFLKAELSDYLKATDYRTIKRIFPAADFITIPGAGHWIHADNPDYVRECFLRLYEG